MSPRSAGWLNVFALFNCALGYGFLMGLALWAGGAGVALRYAGVAFGFFFFLSLWALCAAYDKGRNRAKFEVINQCRCGAEFDNELPKCPGCGRQNRLRGATA